MRELILLILSLVYTLYGFAQQEVKHNIGTENINVIVLKSNGQTLVKNNDSDNLQISSKRYEKGKVIGVKVPEERTTFDVEFSISADTLYLTTPKRFSPKIIGITTYSEVIENTIELPKDKKLVILEADKLYFNNIQNNLVVNSAREITFDNLTKTNIAELKCTATHYLRINDEKKAKEFELHAYGSYYLTIHADKINLDIN